MAAPPKRSIGKWFTMPPATTPEPVEQKRSDDVYAVLRDHVAYAAAIRAEVRQVRREQAEQNKELAMKVTELSSKVDTLISVASDIKSRADAGIGVGVGAPPVQEDDPEVQRLADRIDGAIAILQGQPAPTPVPPAPVFSDPNAPVDPNAPL
jgi:hypothetical protein